jgi:hypothetical protein
LHTPWLVGVDERTVIEDVEFDATAERVVVHVPRAARAARLRAPGWPV